jgi:hypothetical protein
MERGEWDIEIEPEVATWLEDLSPSHFDEVREAIERLAAKGHRAHAALASPRRWSVRASVHCRGGRSAHYVLARVWRPGVIVLLPTVR